VVNLAYPNETAACYPSTLQQYAYLNPDLVLIYSGYNDLDLTFRPESTCFRNHSLVFVATGYMPMLDQYAREKWYSVRYGSVEEGYRQAEGSHTVGEMIADRGNRRLEAPDPVTGETAVSHYVRLIDNVVTQQLTLGRSVLFVTQPYLNNDHREQQAALRASFAALQANTHFRYLDLGNAVDLATADRDVAFDGLHLTARGNVTIANAMIDTLAAMAPPAPTRGSH
jgi:lysophospholipase L1-like esterase